MTSSAIPSEARSFSPRRVLLLVLACFLLLYLGDFAWYEIRLRLPQLGPATGSIHRLRLLALSKKGNKIEYQIDALRPEENVPCSRSLFPRGGNRPCWYVIRHANDAIPM